MEWIEAFKDLNYVAVLIAILSTFVVGMTWYSESVLFGKQWMKLSGLKKEDLESKEGMMKAMGYSTIASVFSVTVLAALILATGTDGWVDSALFGGIVGFGISAASMVTHDAFSMKSFTLTAINGAHDVVSYAVIGAILGGFGF